MGKESSEAINENPEPTGTTTEEVISQHQDAAPAETAVSKSEPANETTTQETPKAQNDNPFEKDVHVFIDAAEPKQDDSERFVHPAEAISEQQPPEPSTENMEINTKEKEAVSSASILIETGEPNVYEVRSRSIVTDDNITTRLFRQSQVQSVETQLTGMSEMDEFVHTIGQESLHEKPIRVSLASSEAIPDTEEEREEAERREREEKDVAQVMADQLKDPTNIFHHISLQQQVRRSTLQLADHVTYDDEPRFRNLSVTTAEFLTSQPQKQVQLQDQEDEGIKEEEEEEEYEPEEFDRKPYYDRYDFLMISLNKRQTTNYILNQMVSRVLRRKMGNTGNKYDNIYTEKTYLDKIEAYDTLLQLSATQRATISRFIDEQRQLHVSKAAEVRELFITLQDRETKIGYGLINSKTGTPIPDKLVARLIRNQKFYHGEICSMRITFVILKDKVEEKLAEIQKLEYKGTGLHLADYEQLKLKNRMFTDKIEEKETDLAKLRTVCAQNIQTLAHLREKLTALESDVNESIMELELVSGEYVVQRKQINSLRRQRDQYRQMKVKLKEETGLLLQPSMLIDMERSFEDYKEGLVELEELKEQNGVKAKKIRCLRSHIEIITREKKRKGDRQSVRKKRTLKSGPGTTRKTLGFVDHFPVPQIDEKAFAHLGKIITGQCPKKKKKMLIL